MFMLCNTSLTCFFSLFFFFFSSLNSLYFFLKILHHIYCICVSEFIFFVNFLSFQTLCTLSSEFLYNLSAIICYSFPFELSVLHYMYNTVNERVLILSLFYLISTKDVHTYTSEFIILVVYFVFLYGWEWIIVMFNT